MTEPKPFFTSKLELFTALTVYVMLFIKVFGVLLLGWEVNWLLFVSMYILLLVKLLDYIESPDHLVQCTTAVGEFLVLSFEDPETALKQLIAFLTPKSK